MTRSAVLLAALAVPAILVAPPAAAQPDIVRGYVPPDELVSFPSSTPMDQFFRLVNPTFARVTGKRVVDPMDRTDPIGVSLNGVHFIDAFEVVLDRNGLDFNESEGYFIVTEPTIVATTTDGQSVSPIGAAPVPTAATAAAPVEVPATADTREIRIDAVIFQLNTRRAREVGTNWPALFGQAAGQGGQGGGQAGQVGGGLGGGDGQADNGANLRFFLNVGTFVEALDGFIEASGERLEMSRVLQLFRYFEEQGYGQTIATPFTVVQSGEEGRMQSGQDIPVQTRDFQGNTISEFFSTGTIINVTPTLIVDERSGDPVEFINLQIKVEKSTAVPTSSGIAINKDDISTRVNLLSGEMAAIGGLTSTDESVSRRGVPILRDIPILKYLFSYRQTTVNQNEIIIVTRARVVDNLRDRMGRELPSDILRQEREDADARVRRFGGANEVGPEVDIEEIEAIQEIDTDR
ncbi:MAG: type II and III secretion system protein [Bacteroidota bacterium]